MSSLHRNSHCSGGPSLSRALRGTEWKWSDKERNGDSSAGPLGWSCPLRTAWMAGCTQSSHAAPFARIYSDFTSESPEQQKSKRAWPVRVRIALLPLMTTVGPQTLHKGKHNTTSATFTQSHSSHGTNEASSPGASHVLCGHLLLLFSCPLWIVSESFLAAILMTDLHEFSHCSYCLQCIKRLF